MLNKLIASVALAAVMGLVASTDTLAAGGQNAYNNPGGDPPEETFLTPYVNVGGGRALVQCAEDEELLLTPKSEGAVEAVCVAAGD